MDDTMRKCYARFYGMMLEVEHTMMLRYEQRTSAENQLRRLIDHLQIKDDAGNGGWEALRNVIAEHMLEEQTGAQPSNVVDMRMFKKMKPSVTEE